MRRQRLLAAAAAQHAIPEDVGAFVQGPAFLFPAELNEALPWPQVPVRNVRRILVMEANARRLRGLGEWLGETPTDFVQAEGQEELLEGPGPNQIVPQAAIETIGRWIDRLVSSDPQVVRQPGVRKVRIVGESGQEITEEIAEFGSGLFGIQTSPVSASATPKIIFANEGYHHHIGPGRLWVDLARQLAALGLTSLRFDLSGFGDSPTGANEREQTVHSPVAFDDMLEAMRFVSPADPRQVVLVGLCSSAYQSLESALEQQVLGVCAINPIVDFLPPEVEDGSIISERRRFCLPPNSIVALAKQRRLILAIRDRYPNLTWRLRHLLFSQNLAAPRFRELVDRGIETLLICGPLEAAAFRQSGPRLMEQLEHTDRFHLEIIPDLDHSLLDLESRDRARRCVAQFVISRFAPTADGFTPTTSLSGVA